MRSVLAPFLQSTCGFRQGKVQWLPAVGPLGQNLAAPPLEGVLASWWQGPSLMQAIDNFSSGERLTSACACCQRVLACSDLCWKGIAENMGWTV